MSGSAQSILLKSPDSQFAQIERTRSRFSNTAYFSSPTALRASARSS
jgi:hypothetical protein